MRGLVIVGVVLLPPSARAGDVLDWNDDPSTCLASRVGIEGDRSEPDSSFDIGPMLDPAHAGWAALDAGCGRTRIGIRIDLRPVATDATATMVTLPVRVRIADDWTIYALPTLTLGTTALGNLPLAVSRRVRALSPFGMLTTVDLAALAPGSTDGAYGVGLGAAVVKGSLGISALALHATTAFDATRALQTGHLDAGATALLGVEVFPIRMLDVVADCGQRFDRSAGYQLWGTLGVRTVIRKIPPVGALGFELAIARDRDASSAWFSVYVLRGR